MVSRKILDGPAGVAVLLVTCAVIFGAEIAFHAYMGSRLPGAAWLLSIYSYRAVPSGKSFTVFFDLFVPCAVLAVATGKLGARWRFPIFLIVVVAVESTNIFLLRAYYMFLPKSSLWWLPDGGKGMFEYYAWLWPIPLAFVLGALVMRSSLRSRDAVLRAVEEI